MTVAEQFGLNLLLARRRAGLTQIKLAALAGMHGSEIAVLEHGRRNPRLDTIVRLAEALDIEPGELLAATQGLGG